MHLADFDDFRGFAAKLFAAGADRGLVVDDFVVGSSWVLKGRFPILPARAPKAKVLSKSRSKQKLAPLERVAQVFDFERDMWSE